MDEDPDAFTRRKREEKVEQIRQGDFREYWLSVYIKKEYKHLGFSEVSGPFETGYDFRGIVNGRPVVVEAERKPYWFVNHKHRKDQVDFLIVMADDDTPRKLLPKNIIVVDAHDLEEKTRDERKHYARYVAPAIQAKREAEQKSFHDPILLLWKQVSHSLNSLYRLVFEDEPSECTIEESALNQASLEVASRYLQHYNLPEQRVNSSDGVIIARIVALENNVLKRGLDSLTEPDWDFLIQWLGLLRDEYVARL